MAEFSPGSVIELTHGTAVIKGKLGEGGQGNVYLAEYNGSRYALKWYHTNALRDPEKFYDNLINNIEQGAPSPVFIWPKDVTRTAGGEFGYIMDLIPLEYKCFSDFLLTKEKFPSVTSVINAALNITNGFRELHRKGFSYQDLNDGNFFIEPKTGSVVICDTDNVAPYGESLGIAGKARYMAPEVVRNIKAPDVMTDRFSLAVILFRLLFLDHPLEGKRTLCPCLTEEHEQKFYGKSPLFIYDKDDKSNRPVRGVHCNVIRLWDLYPKFIRDKFSYVFSQECLHLQKPRPSDNEWQIAFTKLRDCIVKCPCGGDTFIDLDDDVSFCINCAGKIPKPPILKSKKYLVALFPGNKLYRCHIDQDSDDYSQSVGVIIRSRNRPDVWGIKNTSGSDWTVENRDGSETVVPDGKVQIIVTAKAINFGSCVGRIEM